MTGKEGGSKLRFNFANKHKRRENAGQGLLWSLVNSSFSVSINWQISLGCNKIRALVHHIFLSVKFLVLILIIMHQHPTAMLYKSMHMYLHSCGLVLIFGIVTSYIILGGVNNTIKGIDRRVVCCNSL